MKRLFLFMLTIFLLLGDAFAKSKKVTGSVSEQPNLKCKKIDSWTYSITGTEGLSDVCLLFAFYSEKDGFNKALENNKNNILVNMSVVIGGVPCKLKFKESHKLHKFKRHISFYQTFPKTIGYNYVLEFGLDIDENVDLILPDSILIESRCSLTPPETVGPTIKFTKTQNKRTKTIKEYGPKKTPYTCCYVSFRSPTFGLTKDKEAEIKHFQEQVEKKNNLVEKILAKMGYRAVKSISEAVRQGDMFLINGSLYNPIRMFIQDVSFNGSMFSYLIATGYSLDTLGIHGDVFYVLSDRQLDHTTIYGRGDEITENINLIYVGTNTYRQGNTIKECKVFTMMNEKDIKTIRDVKANPEKYRYLVE